MSEIKIGRPASSNPTGLRPVKGYANRPAGTSLADAFAASGIDTDKLKESLRTKNTSTRDLLNERITAQMGQKAQYGGKTVKVGNTYVAQSAAETAAQAAAKRTGTTASSVSTSTTRNLPAVIEKPKYNFMDIIKKQFGISDIRLPQQSTSNLPVLSTSTSQGATTNLPVLYNGGTTGAGAATGAGAGAATGAGARAGSGTASNLPVKITRTPGSNIPSVTRGSGVNPGEYVDFVEVIPDTTTTTTTKPSLWSKFKGFLGKAGKFFKSKAGIATLIGVAVAAAVGGTIAYLKNRFSEANRAPQTSGPAFIPIKTNDEEEPEEIATEVEEPTEAPTEAPVDDTTVAPVEEPTEAPVEDTTVAPVEEPTETPTEAPVDDTTVTPVTTPTEAPETDNSTTNPTEESTDAPVTEEEQAEADAAAVAAATSNANQPTNVSGDNYEVVQGDCVWNIAKSHLKELNKDKENYQPTNIEILRHTKELMKWNNLHYEEDNYLVIIRPGDKLKLKKD